MPNIKLKGQTGEVLTFEDVERVYFDSADQDGEVVYYTHGTAVTKSVEPYFASGNDMNVPIPDGELVTQLTIEKPDELNEDNIRNGKTVAGVKGKFIGDTEEVTVGTTESGDTYDLDFSGGNVVVEPTAIGKVISKATILKPGTLAAENIRKDVEIGGIVGECDVIDYIETDILAEQTFASTLDDTYGYCHYIFDVPFEVVCGETYSVMWGTDIYECEALDASALLDDALFIGNAASFGLAGNDEPFLIGFVADDIVIVCLTDTAETAHTVRIFQKVRSDAEKVTVALSMADGDQVIVPSENGKVLTKVTVTKPDTLLPENIAEGIDIAGIIGTFAGGGGGGEYSVTVIDYDGTVIAEQHLDEGETCILPEAPQHERFIFDGWASPIELTDNTFVMPGQDVFIGASYYTASGATEIDIELNKATGLTFTFNDVLSGVTSIDWGDGSNGNTLTHTYSSYGNYTIKIYGMTAIASSSGGGITGDSSNSNATITGIFFSESVTSIGNYAFTSCRSLETVIIPSGITSIGTYVFYCCYGLSTVIIRSGIKGVGGYSFYNCYHLKTAILSKGITSISDQAFRDCSSLTHIVFPNGLGAIYANAFYGCRSLERVILPDSVTTLGNYTFAYCYRLRDVKLPSGLKVIPYSGFLQCHGLYRIAIPGSVTSVSAGSFDHCTNMKECDFTACTAIPKLVQNTAFNNCSNLMKILVPSSLYSSWITASTWSTASIANKIVAV